MEKLSFRLDVFEGPLDLLLHLIEKNKVNIYDIPIADITGQYLEHLEQLSFMDLEVSSEFLMMAAHLLYIKSKMLLPKHTDSTEEEEDPREQLVARLLEYKKYKEASSFLEERELTYRNIVFKNPDELEIPAVSYSLMNLSIDDLLKAFQGIIKKNTYHQIDVKESFSDIVGITKTSVKQEIREVLKQLDIHKSTTLLELFCNIHLKAEIVTRFLAVLELIKSDIIIIEQRNEQIYIYRSKKNGEVNEY
ncbi:MAG: ScpA family protein [Clostridia bacterium]